MAQVRRDTSSKYYYLSSGTKNHDKYEDERGQVRTTYIHVYILSFLLL